MNENVNMVTNILESFNQLFKGKFNVIMQLLNLNGDSAIILLIL